MKKKKAIRELTVDEAREELIVHFWELVNYWDKVDGEHNQTQKQRMSGLLHSILCTLDGCTGAMPGFEIKPIVPKSDVSFIKSLPTDDIFSRNWFPAKTDIGGGLHEIMYSIGRKHKLTDE